MAKQATAKKTEVAPQAIVEPIKVATPQKPTWEIKDRTYLLKGPHSPITHTLPSRHSSRYPLLWFDEESGIQKELRYGTNQNSALVEEQKGQVTLGHIVFNDGVLTVPKQQQNLQKLLSIYHPLKDIKYYEFDALEIAVDELDDLEVQLDALNAAKEMDVDQAEAILRAEVGSSVSSMSSKELKRDLMLFARRSPDLFIELASDDNIMLRNFAIKATESGVIKLSQDQRVFTWASNGRKLMTVPFDEHPYSAMAAFFKTDEGLEIYKSIEKKIS
jgi:hypothetical protein